MNRLESLAESLGARLACDPDDFLGTAGLVSELTDELERCGELEAVRPPVTVLLVGGDAETEASLRRAGYNVLTAENPEEALRWCAEDSGAIHMLFTVEESPDLRERAAALRPDLVTVCLPAGVVPAW